MLSRQMNVREDKIQQRRKEAEKFKSDISN